MRSGGTLGLMLAWLGGLLIGIFIMLGDELINYAQCCTGQKYPFPFIGSYSIWESWTVMFSMVLLGNFLTLIGTVIFFKSQSSVIMGG